jgi:hypothetical protein
LKAFFSGREECSEVCEKSKKILVVLVQAAMAPSGAFRGKNRRESPNCCVTILLKNSIAFFMIKVAMT